MPRDEERSFRFVMNPKGASAGVSLGDRGQEVVRLRFRDGTSINIGELALEDLDEVHDPPDHEST